MKKLMIICGVVAMSAIAHAASVSWMIGNVYKADGTTDMVATGSASAYMFITQNTTGVDLTTTTKAAVDALLADGDLAGLSALSAAHGVNTGAGGWSGATGLEGFSTGSLSAFVVIFDSADITTAQNYFYASDGATKTATFTSPTGAKT